MPCRLSRIACKGIQILQEMETSTSRGKVDLLARKGPTVTFPMCEVDLKDAEKLLFATVAVHDPRELPVRVITYQVWQERVLKICSFNQPEYTNWKHNTGTSVTAIKLKGKF
ncbi:hypothetical protein BaRGS_00027462 [Batillaria attramentaria]|uniref:Uncharacterized protein n=1 Tax=Batillaria attramentaria TaxID=370345 RepID=A0ABD0K362_9CAEN